LLWCPPFRLSNIRRTAAHWFCIATSYLLVGFPQDFYFGRAAEFLRAMSRFSGAPTRASIKTWGWHFFSQSWVVALILCVAWLSTRRPGQQLKRDTALRIACFVAIPMLILFSRGVASPFEHYTFPFVASFLVALVFLLDRLPGHPLFVRGSS